MIDKRYATLTPYMLGALFWGLISSNCSEPRHMVPGLDGTLDPGDTKGGTDELSATDNGESNGVDDTGGGKDRETEEAGTGNEPQNSDDPTSTENSEDTQGHSDHTTDAIDTQETGDSEIAVTDPPDTATKPVNCGDGILTADEACDDGNTCPKREP
jgi:hypothetical protein